MAYWPTFKKTEEEKTVFWCWGWIAKKDKLKIKFKGKLLRTQSEMLHFCMIHSSYKIHKLEVGNLIKNLPIFMILYVACTHDSPATLQLCSLPLLPTPVPHPCSPPLLPTPAPSLPPTLGPHQDCAVERPLRWGP